MVNVSPMISGPLVLSVEDSDADFSIIQIVLRECVKGLGICRAIDGGQAVTFLRRAGIDKPCPDLILLDVNLPGLDGFGVLQFIKAQELLRDIPVVMFTSSSDNREKREAFALGAEDYITKPMNLEQLITVLAEVASKYLQARDRALPQPIELAAVSA